jgi:hypothetical protein
MAKIKETSESANEVLQRSLLTNIIRDRRHIGGKEDEKVKRNLVTAYT